MPESPDAEERLIRWILIAVPAALIAGFLITVVVVTVMLADNFNVLNWME